MQLRAHAAPIMTDPSPNTDTAPPEAAPAAAPEPTPLAAALARDSAAPALQPHAGALTPAAFGRRDAELDALLASAAVFDLGWRARVSVTGEDRLRWLSGMVSNAVQALPEGEGNYSFLLNAQGRIQGDACVYRHASSLLLDTARDQLAAILAHLDHFIIMDDVELRDASRDWTTLGLAGPRALEILTNLGIAPSTASAPSPGNFAIDSMQLGEAEISLVSAYSPLIPRYELWFAPQHALAVWNALVQEGATPAGLEATEALRVLEAVPLYGVDLDNRSLPQETAQARALNFSKGCYLGQEIVERIRSRATVHKQFRQFRLEGPLPALPADLRVNGQPQPAGRLTSAATTPRGLFALGIVRVEPVEAKHVIEYEGGIAHPVSAPPRASA